MKIWVVLLAMFTLGFAQEESQTLKLAVVPIPEPEMSHLEPSVQDQLRKARKVIDETDKNNKEKMAAAYAELGAIYLAYGLKEPSEACYENSLLYNSESFESNYSMGYLLQSVGRYHQAISHYLKAKERRDNPEANYLLNLRLGECYFKLNQFSHARTAYETAFELNPEGPSVLARLGALAVEEKRYNAAVRYLEPALKKQPEANRLHYLLAMAYRGLGKMDIAREHLSKRGDVGIQPPDPFTQRLDQLVEGYRVHMLTGRIAFNAGRYKEAAVDFEKAAGANPNKPGAFINLGTTLAKLKKYKKALKQFQRASELDPKNLTAHFNLGILYHQMQQYEKAIGHFQSYLKINPQDYQVHLHLANTFVKVKKFQLALGHYKLALKLQPQSTKAVMGIYSLFYLAKQYKEALAVLDEMYSRYPHNPVIVHNLALLLSTSPDRKLRDGKRALKIASDLFKREPYYTSAQAISMAYTELGDIKKALQWIQTALQLAKKSNQPTRVIKSLKNQKKSLESAGSHP